MSGDRERFTVRHAGADADAAEKGGAGGGAIEQSEGFDRLIALWRGVAAQAPDWRLLIIGDGPERDALRRQIEDAGLERQVSLLPARRRGGLLSPSQPVSDDFSL